MSAVRSESTREAVNTRAGGVGAAALLAITSTHTIGAFYEAFERSRARALVSQLDFHYTPKHGSWLDIAENELSCLTAQCVSGRRIVSEQELREQTTAWYKEINSTQRGVDWQMKLEDARIKLQSVYPKIQL